jgi:hypothetical protein
MIGTGFISYLDYLHDGKWIFWPALNKRKDGRDFTRSPFFRLDPTCFRPTRSVWNKPVKFPDLSAWGLARRK